MKNWLIIIILIIMMITSYAWWNNDWTYRKEDVLDNEWGALTYFPYLVDNGSVDTATLISEGKLQADCADLRWLDGSDNTTTLSYEFESNSSEYGCDSANTVIWVEDPSIIAAANESNYLYYGNSGATIGENPIGVWDSNYVGVYHLGNGSGIALSPDSTSFDNDMELVSSPAWVTGVFAYALDFDGSTDYGSINDSNELEVMDKLTLEAWIYPALDAGCCEYIFMKQGNVDIGGAYTFVTRDSGKIEFDLYTSALTQMQSDNVEMPSADEWYYIVGTYDGVEMCIFVNGKNVTCSAKTGSITTTTERITVGVKEYGAGRTHEYWYDGRIDEIRIHANRSVNLDYILAMNETGFRHINTKVFSSLGNEEEPTLIPEIVNVDFNVTNCTIINGTWIRVEANATNVSKADIGLFEKNLSANYTASNDTNETFYYDWDTSSEVGNYSWHFFLNNTVGDQVNRSVDRCQIEVLTTTSTSTTSTTSTILPISTTQCYNENTSIEDREIVNQIIDTINCKMIQINTNLSYIIPAFYFAGIALPIGLLALMLLVGSLAILNSITSERSRGKVP